jgi:hypothetical protein
MRLVLSIAIVWGLITVGQARVLVVHVVAGDELFARSGWLRRALPTGTAGWLVPTAYYSPWNQPHWRPSVSLLDDQSRRTGRTGQTGGVVRFISLVPDAGMAFGVRTAPETLPPAWLRDMQQARWLYVQLREVERAQHYARYCTPQQAERLLQRAWQQIDRWLAFLEAFSQASDDCVMVIGSSAEPPRPWAVWLRGRQVGRGWLWDDSVRVRGAGQTRSLIPTLYAALGLPLRTGHEGRLHGDGKPLQAESLVVVRHSWLARHPLWHGALWIRACWIGLVLIGLIACARMRRELLHHAVVRLRVVGQPAAASQARGRSPRTHGHDAKVGFQDTLGTVVGVGGIALGVASLLPAVLPANAIWSAPLVVLLGVSLLVWLAHALDAPLVGLGTIAGLGLIALMLDTLSGSDWNRHGLFGYTLLGGYRFYGVGNPYAALAMSWLLILCTAWLRIEGHPLGALSLMAFFSLWMGWQSANVGATLATIGTLMVFGISVLTHSLQGRSRRVRLVALMGLLTVGLLSLLLLWFNTPHLRGFLWGVSDPIDLSDMSDMSVPSDLLHRKVWMNLGESLLSPWAILLIGSLFLVWRLRPFLPPHTLPPLLRRAWLTAGILSFLLNDLGTMMAAILAFHYGALLFTQIQQESLLPAPNRTNTIGGER